MKKLKSFLKTYSIALIAIVFFGSALWITQTPDVSKAAEGSGYSGRVDIVDLFGTEPSPQQGPTSTLGQLEDPFVTATRTTVLYLQNADFLTFQFTFNASNTGSTLGWYFETSNSATCEVDGPWSIRPTSTEMVGADFNVNPSANATPTDLFTAGAIGKFIWSQSISGLNASCLRITAYVASSTDNSSYHVSVSPK